MTGSDRSVQGSGARKGLVPLAVCLFVAAPGAAQITPGLGAFHLSFRGEELRGTRPAAGVEALVLVGRAFRFGVGAQHSTHDNVGILGVLAEGRVPFALGPRKPTPYIAVRLGWMRARVSDVDVDGDQIADGDVAQSGVAFGAGGGIRVALEQPLVIDLGVVLHVVGFDDAQFEGTPIDATSASGTAVQLRVGFSYDRSIRR